MGILDNILSGLGRESGGSRGSSTTTTTTVTPPDGYNTNATHQAGSYSSDGTSYHYNSDGASYSVDAQGNVYDVFLPAKQTAAATVNAEDDDNMMLWLLLPFVAMVGIKLYKNMTNSKKRKR